uniref:Serine/arginine repetitive matrix protein 1-like n=1 Tax=Davidia involucrata TaxID=16924 RepID=A0A5B6YU44_DAVIN
MGCCLGTTTKPKAPKTNPDAVPPNHQHLSPESDTYGKDPHSLHQPPPPEEEIVKEVLSETPIPKPPTPTPTLIKHNNNNKRPEVPEVKIEATTAIKPTEDIISEISEVSQMCSFSESLSTTTLTEKREDDGEVTQRVHKSPAKVPRKRPYSGELSGRKERGPRYPARRSSEPSPEKRNHITSRSAQGQTMTTKRRNVGPPPNGLRRDPGEGFGRRSRSPVTRGEPGPPRPVSRKSPSSSTTGRSPVGTAENGGKLEKRNDDVPPEPSESLENPLVSLECFIFL